MQVPYISEREAVRMFIINGLQFHEANAEREGRELTPDEIKRYNADWHFIPRQRESRFNLEALDENELRALQKGERKARCAELTQLAASIDFGSDDDEGSEGADLCQMIGKPEFIPEGRAALADE